MRIAIPPMDPERRALLERIMAAFPQDPAMLAALHQWFGGDIRRCLVGLCHRIGVAVPDADELDGLVLDACEELRVIARWWRPDGGALPWVYGRDRMARLLRRHAGLPTRPLLDADLIEAPSPAVASPDDLPVVVVLDRLVRDGEHPVLRVLREALAVVARRSDRELVLLYVQQQAAGDPSPSHTVGALLERRPAAVRQAFCRTRRRLRSLALVDDRFRPLLALPFLADEAATGAAA